MRVMAVSVLAMCLLGVGFFGGWILHKPPHQAKSSPGATSAAIVTRIKGKVKWFNNAKRYGFIGREDGPDVFVYYTAIQSEGYKSLQVGDDVEFEVVQGQKGLEARNVVKVPATSGR
jgi:cold shock protein